MPDKHFGDYSLQAVFSRDLKVFRRLNTASWKWTDAIVNIEDS